MDTSEIPHPPYRLPILGDLVGLNPRTPVQSSLRMLSGLGPIAVRRLLGMDIVMVGGAGLVAELNDESRFAKSTDLHIYALRKIVGDALFTADDDEPNWQLAHDVLMPAFTREAMLGYHATMLGVAHQLVRRWDNAAQSEQVVDVTADMTRMTLETIGRTGFGYSFDAFDRDKPHPFVAAMNRTLRYSNFPDVAWLSPIRRAVVGSTRRHKADLALLERTVDDVIAARRDGASPEAPDLLDRMLHTTHPDTGARLDPVNIRRQIITFVIAGHETTSGALSFALYYLTRNPEVMARAHAEVDALWGDIDDPEPGYADIAKLRSVRAILDEALRLWPTVPAYLRRARTDTVVGDKHEMKKDDWAMVLLPLAHRDPAVWPDPGRFDPDRFAPGRAKMRPPHAYKPFGTGQRACIGRQFALHEAVLTLGLLIHRYDFTGSATYRLRIAETLTLKPDGFELHPRRRRPEPPDRPAG